MGPTNTILTFIGLYILFSRHQCITHHRSRNPERYPMGIHCTGYEYPANAQATRSCCRKAHVPCKEYISDHRKKPNCIVYDRREEADVKDCCLLKMDWAIGKVHGERCH